MPLQQDYFVRYALTKPKNNPQKIKLIYHQVFRQNKYSNSLKEDQKCKHSATQHSQSSEHNKSYQTCKEEGKSDPYIGEKKQLLEFIAEMPRMLGISGKGFKMTIINV